MRAVTGGVTVRSDVPDERPGGGEPSEPEERLRVSQALAAAAKGLDPGGVPEALCRACVALLPVSDASVSISGGAIVQATWCAGDPTAARLAEAQYTLGDGPCRSAVRQATTVLAADLTTAPDSGRRPVFAHEAITLGVRAVFSLPLGVGAAAVGTLDLYRHTPGGLSARDLRIALWTRDAVTFALMELHAGSRAAERAGEEGVASWLEASEAGHGEVYQAVGMVMVQLDLDPEQALDRMRARAFTQGRTVTEVARDVLARRLRFASERDVGSEGTRRRDAGGDGREDDR
ncbi:GAF and ANTAR domain-containing protein [Streptomyces sp. NPDC050523]|uniref:GAF and ANTAR domain-containing protein n=1 Tax=Streptomyces sp. NPDC050523 TaxID=3365622 RepID=UPI0037A32E97